MRLFPSFLSVLLTPLLIVLPIAAETPSSMPPEAQAKADTLQVRLVDSVTTAVPVNTTTNDGFTVQVMDGSGAPVSDAAVALRMPEDGPSGSFADGSRSAVLYTDADGRAKFTQIRWGAAPGKAVVRVTVVKGAIHAGALIEQNVGATAVSLPVAAEVSAPKPPPVASTVDQPKPAPPTSAQSVPARTSPPPASLAKATPLAVPGTPANVSVVRTGATSAAIPSPDSTSQTAAAASTGVSVTNSASVGSGAGHGGTNTKKWILLAAVAAGAGLGAALAMGGHSAVVSSAPGLTIGTPTLSVGHQRH